MLSIKVVSDWPESESDFYHEQNSKQFLSLLEVFITKNAALLLAIGPTGGRGADLKVFPKQKHTIVKVSFRNKKKSVI